jgi:oligopeptide transport system permease protein
MITFILRRLVGMLLTLWVVFTVSFFLMRAVPGGPYSGERNLPPEIEANIKHRYRLDLPWYDQYTYELGNVLHGDFGLSLRLYDFNVNQIIVQGLPISASLGILAMAFALALGLTAGIASAVSRGSFADVTLMSVATVGIALPNFVIASLAIILFVFLIPVFPAAGWGSFQQLVLPAMCLGALYAAEIARIVRTGMLDVLSQDYIRTARAKGLSEFNVVMRHALPGALLPVVSFLGPATAGILTGSVVIERIFAIPGLGWHFVQAATQRDYTLAMGLVLLYTALLFTMNFLVDLSYGILDPRVELK